MVQPFFAHGETILNATSSLGFVDYTMSVYDFSKLEHALQNLHAEGIAELCALPCRIVGDSTDAFCSTRQQLLARIHEVIDAYKSLDFERLYFSSVEFEHLGSDLLVAYGTCMINLRSGADISALSTLTLKQFKNGWKLVSIEVLDVSTPSAR